MRVDLCKTKVHSYIKLREDRYNCPNPKAIRILYF